jgi:hypothetical protein
MTAPKPPGDKGSDKAAQDAIEGRTPDQSGSKTKPASEPAPAAGPHADPALTNEDATPGSGYLPSPGDEKDAESPGG